MKTDEFKNRYIIKLASSIVIAVCNTIIQMVLPRALSLDEYGFYSYNLNVFTSIVVMANLSTSNAMVSKFSKRNQEIGLVYFYLKFYALVSIVLCVGISLLYSTDFIKKTFAGQTILVVMLGLLSALIQKLLADCVSMYDAFAISRFPALMQVFLKAAICILIMAAYMIGFLNLILFYVVQGLVTAFALSVMLLAIIQEQKRNYTTIINKDKRAYAKEYFIYCRPLVAATIISQGITVVMNWALMRWSGTAEQALFGAAWQLNTIVGYVFSPYAELSKREFAVIYNDEDQLRNRYVQALKLIIWPTTYFAVFIGIEAAWILPLLYGDKYSAAGLVTLVIMYYTIYQAWGQVSGSYMLALEKSKLNAAITIVGQLLTLAMVFLFQIPNPIWPDSLGAVGIALNYLVVNFVSVAIGICAISRGLKLKPLKILLIQAAPILFCSALAITLRSGLDMLFFEGTITNYIIKILTAGIIYTASVVAFILIKPELMGLSKESLSRTFRSFGRKIFKK